MWQISVKGDKLWACNSLFILLPGIVITIGGLVEASSQPQMSLCAAVQTLTYQRKRRYRIVPPSKTKNARKFEERTCGYLMFTSKTRPVAYMAISRDAIHLPTYSGKPILMEPCWLSRRCARPAYVPRTWRRFYLAMTDRIFLASGRLSPTQWSGRRRNTAGEQPRHRAYEILWPDPLTHSDFRVDKAFPELGDIDCSWAPERLWPWQGRWWYTSLSLQQQVRHLYCPTQMMTYKARDQAGKNADIAHRRRHYKVGNKFICSTVGCKIFMPSPINKSGYNWA